MDIVASSVREVFLRAYSTRLVGTGTVLYCTVLRPPLLLVQYEYLYDCTAVVPYFTSNIILRARTSTSRGTVQ